MRTGQALQVALLLAGSALMAGCSQMGTTFPRRTTLGTLKSSVSQLEFENDKLRREVARLKTDTRDIEDRLVQEETENGTLKAKLDDARHLLSQRGYNFGDEGSSALTRGGERSDYPSTLPAGQLNRKRRSPPAIQIPAGRINAVDPEDDEHVIAPSRRSRGDLGSQSRLFSDDERWLPIAQSAGGSASATKK